MEEIKEKKNNLKNRVIEASQLPENEKVYMRKGFDGWRVVYPWKDENGKMNWKNIILGGNWGVLVKTVLIVLFVFLFFYVYTHDTKECREFQKELPNKLPLICDSYLKIDNYGRIGNLSSFLDSFKILNEDISNISIIGEKKYSPYG